MAIMTLNPNEILDRIPPVDEVRQAMDQKEKEMRALAELMRLARARDRRRVQQQEPESAER